MMKLRASILLLGLVGLAGCQGLCEAICDSLIESIIDDDDGGDTSRRAGGRARLHASEVRSGHDSPARLREDNAARHRERR